MQCLPARAKDYLRCLPRFTAGVSERTSGVLSGPSANVAIGCCATARRRPRRCAHVLATLFGAKHEKVRRGKKEVGRSCSSRRPRSKSRIATAIPRALASSTATRGLPRLVSTSKGISIRCVRLEQKWRASSTLGRLTLALLHPGSRLRRYMSNGHCSRSRITLRRPF
jgi:hypothetical protein